MNGSWFENYFLYRVDVVGKPEHIRLEDTFGKIKDAMQNNPTDYGVYRQEWIGHVTMERDGSSSHRYYFFRLEQIIAFREQHLTDYIKWKITLTTHVRGPRDEILDINTLEEFTVEYPYSVEISIEHDGVDIEDWLIENGMAHMTDWKAIKMTHRGVFVLYFRDPAKAVMAKLRWSGVGF